MKVHQIKIDFNITEQIKRYVYVYLIESKNLYLIDSGAYCGKKIIENYITNIGRDISEIKSIFLTHAHPDHIGTAAYFKEKTGCKIYSSSGERNWIENIDLQYKERPIPNFYNIAKSVNVDIIVKDNDIIKLENEISITVISTSGHSFDEVSYKINNVIFVGDSIPIKGDIPIYVNKNNSINSLKRLIKIDSIEYCYPAWDKAYTYQQMLEKCKVALEIIEDIDYVVKNIIKEFRNYDKCEIIKIVCDILNLPANNPLLATTIQSHLTDYSFI